MKKYFALLFCTLFLGCQPAKSFWDLGYQACVQAMRFEPAVTAAAESRGKTAAEYALAICKVAKIADPFVQSFASPKAKGVGPTPTSQALEAARQLGYVE